MLNRFISENRLEAKEGISAISDSLKMHRSTSKWKKIEHSITFISISKKCAKISTAIREIKKKSKWIKLR